MKYFIYTRKSTDSEERQILSIETQLAELREFAAKEKLEIVQSESVASAGGRKGGLGGIPPAPTNFGRNQFEFFRKHTAMCRRKRVWGNLSKVRISHPPPSFLIDVRTFFDENPDN